MDQTKTVAVVIGQSGALLKPTSLRANSGSCLRFIGRFAASNMMAGGSIIEKRYECRIGILLSLTN